MSEQRLLRYLAVDRHALGAIERYEKEVAGKGDREEEEMLRCQTKPRLSL